MMSKSKLHYSERNLLYRAQAAQPIFPNEVVAVVERLGRIRAGKAWVSDYVPLSVRHGNRRKRIGWWFLLRREAMALRLAPWLRRPEGKFDANLEELVAEQIAPYAAPFLPSTGEDTP